MKLKNILYLFAIITLIQYINAQNTNPLVTNVSFVNNIATTGNVDIYYDVTDAEQSAVTISMEVSNDGGLTYYYACTQVTGDIGANVATGTNKHIVWAFNNEHPGESGNNFKIKIITNDGTADGSACPGTATVDYGGKTYHTIQIGDQCWLKENLDVGTIRSGGQSQSNNGVIEKYCYNNSSANCTAYGGLYQWNEAMQYSTAEGAQGICPAGWHIPTNSEYLALKTTVDGSANAIKEVGQGASSGKGTNTSGFSALYAGYYNGSAFSGIGASTYFWSSSEQSSSSARYMTPNYYSDYLDPYGYDSKTLVFSVRCLKDN